MQKHVNLVDLVKSYSNEYLFAKIGVDTAENELLKVCTFKVIQLIFLVASLFLTRRPNGKTQLRAILEGPLFSTSGPTLERTPSWRRITASRSVAFRAAQ